MLNIAIVEDNDVIRNKVFQVVTNVMFSQEIDYKIFSYCSAECLLDDIKQTSIQLAILDIELPGMDGVALAQAMHKVESSTIVIFLTSHVNFMQKAFGINVFRYVLKSESDLVLPKVLHSAIDFLLTKKAKAFNIPGGLAHVFLEEILYIEYIGRNPYITTTDGSVIKLSSCSLKSVFRYLDSSYFMLFNSYLIVNMKYITQLTHANLQLRFTDRVFIISRHKSKKIKNTYQTFLLEGDEL